MRVWGHPKSAQFLAFCISNAVTALPPSHEFLFVYITTHYYTPLPIIRASNIIQQTRTGQFSRHARMLETGVD